MKKTKFMMYVVILLIISTTLSAFADAPIQTDELKQQIKAALKEGNEDLQEELCKLDYSNVIQETKQFNVLIDETKQVEAHKELFGVQYELADNWNIFYENNGKFRTSYTDFLKNSGPIPVLRLGGTSSNHINLMTSAVGSFSERKGTEGFYNEIWGQFTGLPAYRMGLPEIIKMGYENNPDMKFIVSVSTVLCDRTSVNNLAHYLLDDKDESEWGALRAADGIEKPVEIYYWELGNEVDRYTEAGQQDYIATAITFCEAIKEVDSEARLLACGPTAPWGRYWGKEEDDILYWASWHRAIMPELAKYVDAISFHPYYDGYSSEFMMMFLDTIKKDIDDIVEEQQLKDETGNSKNIEVVSTEGTRFVDVNNGPPLNLNFESAVSTAHFYNLSLERPWFTGHMIHNLTGDTWCAFWRTVNEEFMKTPIAMVQEIYNDKIGEKMVYADWQGDEKSGEDKGYEGNKFSVSASRIDDHTLNVFLCNKVAYRSVELKFDFNHNYTLVSETVLKAPNSITYPVNKECEKLTTVTETEMSVSNFDSYTMPTESVVVLTLKTSEVIGGIGDKEGQISDAPEIEAAFSDIDISYAKNEISALADMGIINGDADGMYNPERNITRAEFAAILTGVLGIETVYSGNMWKDVPVNAWYKKYADALYVEGVMQGRLFYPDEQITVSEILILAGRIIQKKEGTKLEVDEHYAINKGLASKLINSGISDFSKVSTRADAAAILYRLKTYI